MTEETAKKPKLELISEDTEVAPIEKPKKFSLADFRTDTGTSGIAVDTLQTALPHHNIAGAKDFVRLHPDEENYWSGELGFVNVPIPGQKRDTTHLIVGPVSKLLHPSRLMRFRMALAAKPHGGFFLCHVPSRNQDNTWVASNLDACEKAKTRWTLAVSLKEQGEEKYKVEHAHDADVFPEPAWPTQSLEELILTTFAGRIIDSPDHVGLARLIGRKPVIS
jgi:hypothetical protein